MLFKDYHIPMIRSGSKTETRREWSENYSGPNAGSVVAATTEMFVPDEDADCYIRIQAVGERPLGTMTDADAQAEGDYETVDEFREAYEEVYGDGVWDPDKVVTVVEFEYVGRERPEEHKELVTDGGQDGVAVEQYVDARRLHPSYTERECWNCGHTWFRRARPAESICRECLWGQGDHDKLNEPTDYGALWYDEGLDREEMRRRYAQTAKDLRDRRSGHVEVRI